VSAARPIVKVALHNLPDAQKLLEPIRKAVGSVFVDFPEAMTCRMEIERTNGKFEAHLEVVLPQKQIILNRAGESPTAALDGAITEARSLSVREFAQAA
jgi:hypothetical protein